MRFYKNKLLAIIFLCCAAPIEAIASLQGSYFTPVESGVTREYSVGMFNGKLAIENAGDIYLAMKMDKSERADFAEYLFMDNTVLNDAECLVTPYKDLTLIEEEASFAGVNVGEVTASGEAALKFVDDQNQKAIITLTPKYKIRQVLCVSEAEVAFAKSKIFFFSKLLGIVPLVKN